MWVQNHGKLTLMSSWSNIYQPLGAGSNGAAGRIWKASLRFPSPGLEDVAVPYFHSGESSISLRLIEELRSVYIKVVRVTLTGLTWTRNEDYAPNDNPNEALDESIRTSENTRNKFVLNLFSVFVVYPHTVKGQRTHENKGKAQNKIQLFRK